MKLRDSLAGILALCMLVAAAAAGLPYHRDIKVFAIDKQAPRTTFMTYADKAQAMTFDYEKSPYYMLLNGTWKFFYTEDDRSLPAGVVTEATDGWKDIKVPGSWETQGFGDAVYVNHPYDFAPKNPKPPTLPEAIPVGVYRRSVEIPDGWNGRTVFLHIGGARAGVYVYVNGKEVGYSEDSKNPAEFRIDRYLKPGANEIAIKVYKWSTGSYLECQDMFRLSGIERDVFLWSQPRTSIRDFRVVSTLDDTYTDGLFGLSVDLDNDSSDFTVADIAYELLDSEGKTVLKGRQQKSVSPDNADVAVVKTSYIQTDANGITNVSESVRESVKADGSGGTVDFETCTIPGVAKWTAETPNLYTLLLTLRTKDGTVTEVVPFHVGFRRIEIKESEYEAGGQKLNLFYVNGQPIKLKGVNVHETSPVGGHYVTPEEMRRNFEQMKLNNINSVRLSHYPQDRRFYEMCDEYGFYVYDEANIESHGMYYDLSKGRSLGNNPDWLQHHLYRIDNMFQRNKNYPSVTIWSLGNEAGNGYNFYIGYNLLKELDADMMRRPVCYERAQWEWNSDMYVPQYPSAAWLESIGKSGADRPVVPSEYAHAMGNSTGDLYGQWQAIYKYPQLQGGYIWDWIDQAIWATGKDGKRFLAYGGDFGKDLPSDGNFVLNGVLAATQTPHPGMAEVKYTHQNVGFEAVDAARGEFRITNRFYFIDLSGYDIRYSILCNGEKVRSGSVEVALGPQQSQTVSVPVSWIKPRPGDEYFVNFEAVTNRADALVPAGHVAAYDQFALPVASKPADKYRLSDYPPLSVSHAADRFVISSKKVNFVFDVASGMVTSYKVEGKEYFEDGFGIQPNFWRGPTDNDYGNGMPKRMQVWKQSSRDFKVDHVTVSGEGDSVTLTADYKLAAGNNYIMTYTVMSSGVVDVDIRFTPLLGPEAAREKTEAERTATFTPTIRADRTRRNAGEVPRIGVRFRMPVAMNTVEYYGRGPQENYADRYMGSPIGRYKTTAEQMYHPYVRPQENGHHIDTRWLLVGDKAGRGLLIKGKKPIEFNALRNSVEDFDSQEADAPYQWSNRSPEEIAGRNEAKAKDVLRKQTHSSDIEFRDFVEVCLDMEQMGVGGYDSWGSRPIGSATIYSDCQYDWSFTLIPVGSSSDAARKAKLEY